MTKTRIEELNEQDIVIGEVNDFDSIEHFIEVATQEHGNVLTAIENTRIEKCVYAAEGLPYDTLRPLSEAFLEFIDCYVADLTEKRHPLAIEFAENLLTEEYQARVDSGKKTAKDFAGQYLYYYPINPLVKFQYECSDLEEDFFNEISKLIQDSIDSFK